MSALLPLILEHMAIVLAATAISVVLGVLLGVIAYWVRGLDAVLLSTAEAIQTIPSLALLALLMIVFGLGNAPLIAGLVLYALLPILRLHAGSLPVTFEYRSREGVSARVRAGDAYRLRFDPDLAEKLAKEAGCALGWEF